MVHDLVPTSVKCRRKPTESIVTSCRSGKTIRLLNGHSVTSAAVLREQANRVRCCAIVFRGDPASDRSAVSLDEPARLKETVVVPLNRKATS